ncbi:hypothetical protein [Thalassospira povalilytica]|uniref:hypothetical protein n=1 Tax=Thalassospira povalilytica TaxID=732237 RepID=UPI001D196403|nr:hypothetical protein [Thalassospira povalilytica]MCC4240922.1 hypothetical protein [Thalassospira povalilytica]
MSKNNRRNEEVTDFNPDDFLSPDEEDRDPSKNVLIFDGNLDEADQSTIAPSEAALEAIQHYGLCAKNMSLNFEGEIECAMAGILHFATLREYSYSDGSERFEEIERLAREALDECRAHRNRVVELAYEPAMSLTPEQKSYLTEG